MKKRYILLAFFLLILTFSMFANYGFAITSAEEYGTKDCTLNSQCQSGKCVTMIDTAKRCGCSKGEDCPNWGTCDASAGKCSSKRRYGAPCSAGTCNAAAECDSRVSQNGRCGCNADSQCPVSLGVQLKCDTVSKTCKSPFGATCTTGFPAGCLSGKCVRQSEGSYKCGCTTNAECGSGKTCNTRTGRCDISLSRGGPSEEVLMIPSGSGTSPATECNSGLTCVSGRCEGQAATNAACTSPSQCISGICKAGKCSIVCLKNDECANGKTCDLSTGTCIVPRSKAIDAACLQNEVCRSGSCYSSKCRVCASNTDCTTFVGTKGILGGACLSGVCLPLLENNAACYTPDQCKSGICGKSMGAAQSVPKKCMNVCMKNEYCAGGKVCDLNTGTCIVPRSKATDAACLQNEVCRSGSCYNSKCQASCGAAAPADETPAGGAIGGIGAPCTTALQASQCQTGYCKDNQCAACTIKTNCGTGKVCALCSGICASKISGAIGGIGAGCTTALQCQTGYCKDSQCAACTTDAHCGIGKVCALCSGICASKIGPSTESGSETDRLIAEINALIGTIKARLVRLRL